MSTALEDSIVRLREVLKVNKIMDLLEPLDSTLRADLVAVAEAYLLEHDGTDDAAVSETFLKSLGAIVHDRYLEIASGSVQILFAVNESRWTAFLGGIVLPMPNRGAVRSLLAGLQVR